MIENNYVTEGDITRLQIVNKKGEKYITIFNTWHLPKIQDYKWYVGYVEKVDYYFVSGYKKGEKIQLNRLIKDCHDKKMVVDHINHDSFDNTDVNLRICTKQQNNFNRRLSSRNTSGHKGVSFNKNNKKYISYITINRNFKFLGYFNEIEDAVLSRKKAEEEIFGEYSPLLN